MCRGQVGVCCCPLGGPSALLGYFLTFKHNLLFNGSKHGYEWALEAARFRVEDMCRHHSSRRIRLWPPRGTRRPRNGRAEVMSRPFRDLSCFGSLASYWVLASSTFVSEVLGLPTWNPSASAKWGNTPTWKSTTESQVCPMVGPTRNFSCGIVFPISAFPSRKQWPQRGHCLRGGGKLKWRP
jgi:hypothetical protein